MADLLFKCPQCSTNLVVDAAGVGRTVPCSECGSSLQVPLPTVAFRCSQCQAGLCAPHKSVGAAFACPQCSAQVVVPPRSTHKLDLLNDDATNSGSASASASAAHRQCPQCGSPVAPAAIVCLNCGTNLLTGKTYGHKTKSRPGGGNNGGLVWSLLALVVLIGVGGWFYMEKEKEEGLQRAAEIQRATDAAKAQQVKAEADAKRKKLEAEAKAEAARKKAEADAREAVASVEAARQKALAQAKAEHEQEELRMVRLRSQPFHVSDANLHDVLMCLPANSNVQIRTLCSNAVVRIHDDVQRQKDQSLAQYGKALDAVLGLLKQKNDHEAYPVVEQEAKRFQSENEILFKSPHASLATAVSACQVQVMAADAESTRRTVMLMDQYINAIDTMIKNATAQGSADAVKAAVAAKEAAKTALAGIKSRQASVEQPAKPPAAPPEKKPVPADAIAYKGHHYKVFADVANWDWAQQKCIEMDGHLVVIHNGDENDFVHGLIQHYTGAWIGAERTADTAWRWVTGSSFGYEHWSTWDRTSGGTRNPSSGMKAAMFGDRPWDGNPGNCGWWTTQPGHETRFIPAYVCEWDY